MSPASPPALRSALYEGTVTHRRSDPPHAFSSRVVLPLLYLDELSELRSVHPLVDFDPTPHRRRWPAAMRLRRSDFLPPESRSLLQAVTDAVATAGGTVRGPVAMLGHVRTWGWLFNPVTLYYCFDATGHHVETTVLEVSNTPWHERCRYVVGPPGLHHFAKAMHVSPFLPDAATYTLRYRRPRNGSRWCSTSTRRQRPCRMVDGTNPFWTSPLRSSRRACSSDGTRSTGPAWATCSGRIR